MSDTFTDRTLNTFLHNLEKAGVETHAICVWHEGKEVLNRAFFPYDLHTVHPVWSVTKSFTSLAMGFLQQEDPVDLNSTWISFFPEYENEASDTFRRVTLRNLLTMNLGQDAEAIIHSGDDWIRQNLRKQIVYEPGTKFFYNSNCTYLIGRLIEKRTGMHLVDYLKPRLFEPLGITDYYWDRDEESHCLGGYGLHLKTEDLAKVGECILEHGKWNGKQVIPEEWLKEATRMQVQNETEYPLERSENRQGYGYCFWGCTRNAFRMSGLHGQLCYIRPDMNLVIAMSNATTGSQILLNCLNAAFDHPQDVPERDNEIALPQGKKDSPCLQDILGTHPAGKNPAGIRSITISRNENALAFAIDREGKAFTFSAVYGKWLEQENLFHGYSEGIWSDIMVSGDAEKRIWPAYAGYAFELPDVLHVEARERNEAAKHHFIFHIDKDYMSLDYTAEALLTYFPSYHVEFSLK